MHILNLSGDQIGIIIISLHSRQREINKHLEHVKGEEREELIAQKIEITSILSNIRGVLNRGGV